jgi:sulfur carrier protein ThiS
VLRRQTPDGFLDRLELELDEGATVGEVLEALEMEAENDSLLLVVNGRTATLEQELFDGDELRLMHAISGGKAQSR